MTSLRTEYNHLLSEAQSRGMLHGRRADAIRLKLATIRSLLGSQQLGDGEVYPPEYREARKEYIELVRLFVALVAKEKIAENYAVALAELFKTIGKLLDLSFAAYFFDLERQSAVKIPDTLRWKLAVGAPENQSIPEPKPPVDNVPNDLSIEHQPEETSQDNVPFLPEHSSGGVEPIVATIQPVLVAGHLSIHDYSRFVRSKYLHRQSQKTEQRVETLRNEIDHLEKKPDTFQGTQKEWLESVKGMIGQKRAERDALKAKLTRLRNDELGQDEQEELTTTIQAAWEESGGILTDEERQQNIDKLLPRIFEEDSISEQFYPTPSHIVQKYVIAEADLQPGLTVLEPSAGKGDIADAVRASCPDCLLDVIEINQDRADLLLLKGYNLVARDTVTFESKQYDRILMNPPFGGIGIVHVRHCYDKLLKPGGRLVALLNPGAYYNGQDIESLRFKKNLVDRVGKVIDISNREYSEGIERAITIGIITVVLNKPLHEEVRVETLDARVGMYVRNHRTHTVWKVVEIDESKPGITLLNERSGDTEVHKHLQTDRWEEYIEASGRLILPDRPASAIDTSFTTPSVVTARKDLTKPARGFYVDRSLLNDRIKDYVIEGANYAIEALEAKGGFLLADGTGAGKTVQELLVACYWYRKTGKPVLILTESDQIIQSSFFGDAQMLGLDTPDKFDRKQKASLRPSNYKGLYDGDSTQDRTPLHSSLITVRRFRPKDGVLDGINVGTYNDISNIDVLRNHPLERAVKEARVAADVAKKEYAEQRRDIQTDKLLGKYDKEVRIKAIDDRATDDPRFAAVITAEENWVKAQEDVLRPWVSSLSCLIYDECHNIKNTGPGGSNRATRSEFLSNAAPCVMFVSATPADKAGDIVYLKRAGLYQNDQQFKRIMEDIGYRWVPEIRNKRKEIIRRGEYKIASGSIPERLAKSLARLFDQLTENGYMLKRELELTNLEPPAMIDVPVTAAVESLMEDIETALINKYESVHQAEILMEQKRALEPYKVDACIEIARQELMEGRSVIVFADLVDDGQETKAWGEKKAGVIRILKERFKQIVGEDQIGLAIGVQGPYETQERLNNIKAFQAGSKRVMLATIGSGGTGISLDDTVGNAPRTIIILTAPMNSIKTVQVMGRIVRANTRSRSRVKFLFCDLAIDTWLKNLLATKLTTLGAMVEGQVTLLNPKEVEAIEAGGDDSTASAYHSSQDYTKKKKEHTLYRRRSNNWLDGRDYPAGARLYVGRFKKFGEYSEYVRVRGVERSDIVRLALEQAEMFAKFGMEKRSEQYVGTYYQCPFSNDAWTWALNLIKREQAEWIINPRQIFNEGDVVQALEDITQSGTRQGTKGTITVVRPRNGYYLYDVTFEDGTFATSIEQEILGVTRLHSFQPGQVFTNKRTERRSYYDEHLQIRSRITILSITDDPVNPTISAEVATEKLTGDVWVPHTVFYMSPQPVRQVNFSLDELELAIHKEGLTCTEHCTPPSTAYSQVADAPAGVATDIPSDPLHDGELGYMQSNEQNGGDEWERIIQGNIEQPGASLPPIRSVSEVRNLDVKRRPLSARFQALFGRVSMNCRYFVHGPAGHGKSSLALQFSDEIARQEAGSGAFVLYINAEQPHDSGGMTDRLRNNRVRSQNIHIVDTNDFESVKQLLRTGRYTFMVIDSISRMRGNNNERVEHMLDIYEEFPALSTMLIAHEDKQGKTFKGGSDWGHDCHVWVRVEEGIASTSKNQFGPSHSIPVIPYKRQASAPATQGNSHYHRRHGRPTYQPDRGPEARSRAHAAHLYDRTPFR